MPRISNLLRERGKDVRSVIFATHEGCLPVPDISSSKWGNEPCNYYRDSMLAMLKSGNVRTVVLGACWACYLIYHVDDTNSPQYEWEINQRELALRHLKQFIELVRQSKIEFYLLGDDPASQLLSPSHYVNVNRFGSSVLSSSKPYPERVRVSQNQFDLRDTLRDIAERAGAHFIDPLSALCDDKRYCIISFDQGTPIYKDTNHLRSTWVKRYASFMDQTVIPGPQS